MSILDGIARVALLHAHPDDETLATGALIALLASRGVLTGVLTATRGERGGVVHGPLANLAGTPELVEVRERELASALDILGVDDHVFLGTPPARAGNGVRSYEDSGMAWVREGLAGPAEDIGPGALTSADESEVVADMVTWLRAWRPDLVVTYDDGGGYGHPDHVLVHRAGLRACRELGLALAETVYGPGEDVEWFEAAETLPVLKRALRAHATQLTVDGDEVIHSGGQREGIVTAFGLRLLPDG